MNELSIIVTTALIATAITMGGTLMLKGLFSKNGKNGDKVSLSRIIQGDVKEIKHDLKTIIEKLIVIEHRTYKNELCIEQNKKDINELGIKVQKEVDRCQK